MKKTAAALILIISYPILITAQELPLITDKPGTFEILSRADYVSPECGFTKTEISANLQKITGLVNTIRKNPVLSDIRGFDGRARIYTVMCKDNGGYGIPSRISFEFASWYKNKDGTAARGLIEPPEWSLVINKLVPTGYGFSSDRFSSKPDFFTVPLKKETIAPGIDAYEGECMVLYNPDRPAYWLPVTVKEAFDVVFAENRKNPDQIQRDFLLKYLNEEWISMPTADWNKPATLSGMVSRVGTDPAFPSIMKVNPLYWDRNCSKSVIQFIYFRMVPNKEYYRKLKEEYLQKNSISYHVVRFEESFDLQNIQALSPLIGK
jgi:hypothetical protein